VKTRSFLLIIISIMALCREAGAEHIIGGEMYYECIGPGQYIFTMKLWRDCNSSGANFDNPATFGIFNESGVLVQTVSASTNSVVFVDTDLDSPCLAIPPNICVQQGTYVFPVEGLNPNISYSVVYQRCCRNQTIQNLTNPGAQGLTIQATIPRFSSVGCNASPSFNNFPPPVLCSNEPLVFDHSATDSDGDSLVYSLCAPFIGASQADPMPIPPSNPPYPQVLWSNPYNSASPLAGNPGLNIDPQTGQLTVTPTQLGQYVVGVCVEEWRDGVLLSTNTRDFQFNVAFCEPTSDAIIAEPELQDLCQSLNVTFFNLSNPTNTFVWDFGDPDNENDQSTDYHGNYTFPDTGSYTITLITNPGFFCSDTALINVVLGYQSQIGIVLTGFECVNGTQAYSFEAVGEFDPDQSTVIWTFGDNASVSTASGVTVTGVSFSEPGPQVINIALLNNACSGTGILNLNVVPPPDITITPQSSFCTGLSHNFTQTSSFVNQYLWNFGVPGNDGAQSTLANPNFVFPNPGLYTVSLTAQGAGNCPVTVTEEFNMQFLLAPQIPSVPTLCFENNSLSIEAGGSFQPGASFVWNFENAIPAMSNIQNPQISFLQPGSHLLTLAVSENGCTRFAERLVNVHENPYAEFDAFPLQGCAPLTVTFKNQSFTQSSNVAYTWNYGDGNTGAAESSTYEFIDPGVYSVSLFLENLNGCIDTDFVSKPELINVLPSPKASFSTSPEKISVIDPEVTITDLSTGNTACSFFFDNTLFTECNFSHMLQNIEPQPISLTVVNEYGCTASAEGMIYISDHLIYVPNSFSPNGDGINDIFMPVTTAVATFQMHILDRWGREVYSSDDVTRGWDGSINGGNYYAETGIYQYIITVTDYLNWNFDYTGTVTLLR
jgi:gliding motility-associated-like protein